MDTRAKFDAIILRLFGRPMTRVEAARRLGVETQTVSNWRNRGLTAAAEGRLARYARRAGVKIEDLLE